MGRTAYEVARATRRWKHQVKILAAAGFEISKGTRILDIGCGEGENVRAMRADGYDAWGCDIGLRDTPRSREMIEAGLLKQIPTDRYWVPFDDAHFDVVFSVEVLEHVLNYPEFISENRRVQKPGGVALHIFPGPYTPLEMHCGVPLATIHRSYPWLLFWAALGIRNWSQKGASAREVARHNFLWLPANTNYLKTSEVRRLFGEKFSDVQFREDLFLEQSVSARGRFVNRLVAALPMLLPVYRNFWNRVLLARI